jgi:hypothetical protein
MASRVLNSLRFRSSTVWLIGFNHITRRRVVKYRDIDQYIALAPEAARTTLETLRRTIRAAAPTATESIRYPK